MITQEAIATPTDIQSRQLLQFKTPTLNKGTVPTTILIPSSIQGQPNHKLLQCLFDIGGSHTIINKRALPAQIEPEIATHSINATTAAGTLIMKNLVTIKNSILPEFSK